MKRKSSRLIAVCSIAFAVPIQAADFGFPSCNTMGRYFGVGWSHHTYHSNVNGRYNILDQRHPATDYPSRHLGYPYSPHYVNYASVSDAGRSTPYDWTPLSNGSGVSNSQMPTLAPEPASLSPKKAAEQQEKTAPVEDVPSKAIPPKIEQPKKTLPEPKKSSTQPPKPTVPPPDWLKPFLDPSLEGTPAEVEDDESDLIELQPSPSDNSNPKSATLPPLIINRYKVR